MRSLVPFACGALIAAITPDAIAASSTASDAIVRNLWSAAAPLARPPAEDLPEEVLRLYYEGARLHLERRDREAEPTLKRSLALGEEALATDDDPRLFHIINLLGEVCFKLGRFSEAGQFLERALALRKRVLGSDHMDVAASSNNLAEAYRLQGRYGEAEVLQKEALSIAERAPGLDRRWVAAILNNLALLYEDQGRYAEAEAIAERSVAIWEQVLGRDHPDLAQGLSTLALAYQARGRFAEAEPVQRRSLEVREKALGRYHPDVAQSLANLAALYGAQGRYAEAEPLSRRALAILQKALPAEHRDVAATLRNLASLLRAQGRYGEAEQLYERALAIRDAAAPGNPDDATALNDLASVYLAQGRYEEAAPLFEHALDIWKTALGSDHPYFASGLNNLAQLYFARGRYAEAEALNARVLAIREKALGRDHPDVAQSVNNLAESIRAQGRYADAAPLYFRSLAIVEKALGPDHPGVATILHNLAGLYHDQSRDRDGEPLVKRAISIRERAVGPDHPAVAQGLTSLALLYRAQGRYVEALPQSRRATLILAKRMEAGSLERSTGPSRELRGIRPAFLVHVEALAHAGPITAEVVSEAFETAQLAQAREAAQAVSQMAARFAAGTSALAAAVRERQDAVNRWRALDQLVLQVASEIPEKRDPEKEKRLRAELTRVNERLTALDAMLAGRFPEFAELALPRPVKLDELQPLLKPGEALVSYLVGETESWAWIVRPNAARFVRLAIGRSALEGAVERMRASLTAPGLARGVGEGAESGFDTGAAWEIYAAILAPAAGHLQGVQHVMVVPDGPLQSLPFAALVMEETKRPESAAELRRVPWLMMRYAVSTLPSVGTVRVLRRLARTTGAAEPFVGFGDPVLEGARGDREGLTPQEIYDRGAVDVQAIRNLRPLPETADELKAVAKALGAGPETVHLRSRATETAVRMMRLDRFRVVAFSTHGLVSGDFEGQLAEPALVLTPPRQPTPEDDGLLTASDIALLRLNADWVVLSACNTAAPDGTTGAEGLTGLAKAFFYSGSRALLVSHWSVSSEGTRDLVTLLFAGKARPNVGRAEALQQAMRQMLDDPKHPRYAHPFFWAPFVVVGDAS